MKIKKLNITNIYYEILKNIIRLTILHAPMITCMGITQQERNLDESQILVDFQLKKEEEREF